MNELKAFYNNPSGSKVVKLRGGQTCGVRLTKEDMSNNMGRKEEHEKTVLLSGTDYAREIKEREKEMYLLNIGKMASLGSYSGGMESLEQLSHEASLMNIGGALGGFDACTEFGSEDAINAINELYKKYSFQIKEESFKMAINDYKQQIIDSINSQEVIIIEGPTGCGKTTQVPQWILDDCYQKTKHCKIVVTQPRRIAAISIAKRVAQERGWDVGGLVGYQVGLDNRTTNDTRIHYVTTGVLLQKLVNSKSLNEYTHIVLDEVHERGQEMDFLLLVVKRLLNTVSRNVKVILMSATFNCAAFADYFATPTSRGLEQSPWVQIPKKKTMFTVKTFYLDDLHKLAVIDKCLSKSDTPNIEPDMYKLVIHLIHAFEGIDQQEDDYKDHNLADIPSVLIFLPGINEIEDLYGYLTNMQERTAVVGPKTVNYKWLVLPLHSTITVDEQVRVFQRAPVGNRKIILSTNIAESSITVPDIKYVIDFCLMKVLVADEQTNFTSLQLHWASKTNCEQRAGRAGRVRDGRVYRLVTDTFYGSLNQECPPEIQRAPLERLVLLAKELNMGPPVEILALAMDPPDLSNIHRTVLVLKEIGALHRTVNGELSVIDGDITYLGRICSKLPLDVRVSKLIMLGHIFGCLEESVIMAAAMSVKNIFSSPFRERLNAYNSKLTWADGSNSDSIAFYNAYRVWVHFRKQQFKQPGNNENHWARRFYMQVRSLRELDDMVKEINLRLSREGIEPTKGSSPYTKNELPLIQVILLAGAFYPNYFVQVGSDENREREAVKTLSGHDPRTTVYLKDFPLNQPGALYGSAIKEIFQKYTHEDPRVTFDVNSCKVFLTFDGNTAAGSKRKDGENSGNPAIPGKVVLPVYKAVKARQLRIDIRVPLLPPERAKKLAVALESTRQNVDKGLMVPKLPEIDDTHIPIRISQFIDCSSFYAQYDDESTASDLRQIESALNSRPLLVYTGQVVLGEMYAAPYTDENGTMTCRVRVQKILPKDMVWVLYIDWGSYGRVSTTNLRDLPAGVCRELQPLAMQCALAEVAPSSFKDTHARWVPQATKLFQDFVKLGKMFAKVYSVSHGVVAVELLAENGRISVNKELIARGFARPCEESYESKLNHDLRETASELGMAQKRGYNKQQVEHAFQELWEVEPPAMKECDSEAVLKGPFSPLETAVHSLMYASREKPVGIEWNSVNSVLLDTEPQENYQRLLVAASVGTNEMATNLTLRHTTLMPNIPGLPIFIALLFSPKAELRRNASASRYVSALCGLGHGDRAQPLFPEHDLLLDIDVDLTVEDVGQINHIRHLMDYMMFCGPGQDTPTKDNFQPQVPENIRLGLLRLLTRRRKYCMPEMVPNAWEWCSTPEEDLLEITEESMLEHTVIYPMHVPVDLRPRPTEELRALKREVELLTHEVMRTSSSATSTKLVQCKLCSSERMTPLAMRIHLYSRSHRDKLEDLRDVDY